MQRMDICARFGANVRRVRRSQDMTQETLADLAGVNRSYLSELERSGKGNPTLKVMERLARALEVSLSSLLD